MVDAIENKERWEATITPLIANTTFLIHTQTQTNQHS